MKTNHPTRHAIRRTLQLAGAVLVAQAALAASSSAQLKINRNFTGGAPPGNLAGGGDLQTIFNEAADTWERTLSWPVLDFRL